MFVKQITVFIENRPGRLCEFTALLAQNSIDLVAISVADTTNFGILRAIVNHHEKAAEVLRQNGFTANITDVLGVAVPDEPGGLAKVLGMLCSADISIEYLYSLVRRVGHQAVIIFKVDKPAQAMELFTGSGVKLLAQSEIGS